MKQSRYHKDVSAYDMIDVYDVLRLYEVESHPVGHAIKKLLMARKRAVLDTLGFCGIIESQPA